jgi:hypothetical protein
METWSTQLSALQAVACGRQPRKRSSGGSSAQRPLTARVAAEIPRKNRRRQCRNSYVSLRPSSPRRASPPAARNCAMATAVGELASSAAGSALAAVLCRGVASFFTRVSRDAAALDAAACGCSGGSGSGAN